MLFLISTISFLYGLVFIMWLESWLYFSDSVREWRISYRNQVNVVLKVVMAVSVLLIVISLTFNSPITYLFLGLFFFILGLTVSHYFSFFSIGPELD